MLSQTPVGTVRVLVADDDRLFVDALMELLAWDERIEIVGQAKDGREAVELARDLRPALILMDLRMPRMDGIEAAARIRAELPDTRVLILTATDTADEMRRAAEAGVSGYLTKDSLATDLVSGILQIAALASAGRNGESASGRAPMLDFRAEP